MPVKASIVQASAVQAAVVKAATVREGATLPALLLADGADYIDTGEDTAFDFALSSFSIVGFIKTATDGTPFGRGIFAKWDEANVGYRLVVYPATPPHLRVYLFGAGGNANVGEVGVDYRTGAYVQVGIIVDRTANQLWVCRDQARRGISADISTVGDVSNATNLWLGNWRLADPTDSLTGSMSCVHVYPRALVDADLAAIYAAPDTPLSGCLAFWRGDIDGNTIAETAGDAGGPYTATGSGVEADPDGFSL